MVITFWSVPISDIRQLNTGTVTVYNVGAAVRHELKYPLFHARAVAIGATAVVGLLFGPNFVRGAITNWPGAAGTAAILWASMFVLASGTAVAIGGERAGRKMTALARAAHGADRRVAVRHPVPLVWAFVIPKSDDKPVFCLSRIWKIAPFGLV